MCKCSLHFLSSASAYARARIECACAYFYERACACMHVRAFYSVYKPLKLLKMGTVDCTSHERETKGVLLLYILSDVLLCVRAVPCSACVHACVRACVRACVHACMRACDIVATHTIICQKESHRRRSCLCEERRGVTGMNFETQRAKFFCFCKCRRCDNRWEAMGNIAHRD